MVEFRCDGCKTPLKREEAWQVNLISHAYALDPEEKRIECGELCDTCAAKVKKLLHILPKEDKPKKKLHEGRCITVARARAGMSQQRLAELTFYESGAVGSWEQGRSNPPWEALYKVLPELPEIREKGCAAFCEQPRACLGGAPCFYTRRRGKKGGTGNAP